MAIVATGNEDGEVLTVSVEEPNCELVLNSGCTYHMCPNQGYFPFYNKVDGVKSYLVIRM